VSAAGCSSCGSPFCPWGAEALLRSAQRLAPDRGSFARGVYVVTEGPRFESPAEVRRLQGMGDIVGQSFSPEVCWPATFGACYAGIQLIVNYGEGVVLGLEPTTRLRRRFTDDARLMGRIVLDAAAALAGDEGRLPLSRMRKPTLLA